MRTLRPIRLGIAVALLAASPRGAVHAGVIPPFVVSEATTLIERTRTTGAATMGATSISVAEDGFIVGADITIGGEANEVAGAGMGVITLARPLTADHPAGSSVVHKPVFAELTVASSLTVKDDGMFPDFTIPVQGTLTVPSGGVLEVAVVPGGRQITFQIGGAILVDGMLNTGMAGLALRGQTGALLGGSATGSRLTLVAATGPVTVDGAVSSLDQLFITAGAAVRIETTETRALTIFGGTSVTTGALSADGAVSIRGISGNVVTGPITSSDFIAIGRSISFLRIGGNVTTGPLSAPNASDPGATGFVALEGINGNLTTPSVNAGGFIVIEDVRGTAAVGPLAARGFIAIGPMSGTLEAGDLTATDGFIVLEGVAGDAMTGTLRADGSEGFVIIGGRQRMRGSVRTGLLSANGSEGFIIVEGLDQNLTTQAITSRDVRIADVRGGVLFAGPVAAAGTAEISGVNGTLVVDVAITAGGEEGPLGPPAGDDELDLFLQAMTVDLRDAGSLVARHAVRIVGTDTGMLAGAIQSREGNVLLEGDTLLLAGVVSGAAGALCVAAPEVRVAPEGSLSALRSLWVSSEITFEGDLRGTSETLGVHIFRLPSSTALEVTPTGSIVPDPRITPELVSSVGKGCSCRAEISTVVLEHITEFPDCPPEGMLMPRWGSFGVRQTLEADSKERLALSCQPGGQPGDPPFYLLEYTPPGGSPQRVGMCPFHGGCNTTWFTHPGDKNGDARPDCLFVTGWRSRDYGANDDAVGEVPPLLDHEVFTLDTATSKTSVEALEYAYRIGPPVPSGTCKDLTLPRPEGELVRASRVDPPLGPENDALFDELIHRLQSAPRESVPMEGSPVTPCDITEDGHCNGEDLRRLDGSMGKCFGQLDYEPRADANGDGCVGADDRRLLFPNEPDNHPPDAMCRDVMVPADLGACTAHDVGVDSGSADPDGDPITLAQTPPGSYGLGSTEVTLTVTDDQGAFDSCTATVTVVDQEAPTITSVSASPNVLWPPNHRMVPVTVAASGHDTCDPSLACAIVAVVSNEHVNGPGDGNTAPDWEVTGPLALNLRAERAGGGTGRIYSITVRCVDASGNGAPGTTTVTVPHRPPRK